MVVSQRPLFVGLVLMLGWRAFPDPRASDIRFHIPEFSCSPRPPNVPLLRAIWSLLDGIWGLLKGSWGVLGIRYLKCIENDTGNYLSLEITVGF